MIQYIKTDKFIELANLLSRKKPDWHRITYEYKTGRNSLKVRPVHQYVDDFKDILLLNSLEGIAEEDSAPGIMNWNLPDMLSGKYNLKKDCFGRAFLSDRFTGMQKRRYGNIVFVGDLPVVVEASLRDRNHERAKGALLKKALKSDIGYILSVPDECASGLNMSSFKARGGIVSNFYTSSEEFKDEVRSVLTSIGLYYTE